MPAHDQRWVEVIARVAPDDVDAVADALREAGAEGVAIEPAILVDDNADFHYEETDAPSLVRATFPSMEPGAPRRALRARRHPPPHHGSSWRRRQTCAKPHEARHTHACV